MLKKVESAKVREEKKLKTKQHAGNYRLQKAKLVFVFQGCLAGYAFSVYRGDIVWDVGTSKKKRLSC